MLASLRLVTCAALVLTAIGASTPSAAQAPAAATAEPLAIPATDEGLPGAGPIRRYEWFEQLWLSRRSAWAERVEQDRNAVVFLGDSITQGWEEVLPEVFPELDIANRGISGDTTRGVLIRLEEDVLALDPQAVVLLIGTNDLEEGADPETIASNVALILEELVRHDPSMPIVLCEVFPSSPTMRRPAEQIRAVNALYEGLAASSEQVTLLEIWARFADENGNAKSEEFPDLLHPNELGYDKWGAALRDLLTDLDLLDEE